LRPSVRPCVCDHWTQRKVTVDAEESDGKKKSDGGRREKWREKDKTTVGWRAFEVLKPRSWEPNTEGLKPRSWDPGPETSRWGPETQVLRAKYRGPETQVLRAKYRGPETQVLRARSWNLALRAWNPGPEIQVLKPRIEVLKSRSWEPNIEVLKPGPDSVRALLIGWSN
jgi:hypothetical protein